MILFRHPNDLSEYLQYIRTSGKSIGFVPTMGALHDGHLSLIQQSHEHTAFTVVSIFVNPTQFNDANDFTKYPVTIEKDIQMLIDAGVDALLLPSVEEIYPNGFEVKNLVDLGMLEQRLEGKFRPGHFAGVCQVMDRLLGIVSPDELFMGQKDYQQCMVVGLLIDQRHEHIHLNIAPTLREKDGLAMSSRNLRLSEKERLIAPALYNALSLVKVGMVAGDNRSLLGNARQQLVSSGFKIDYFEVVNASTLSEITHWDGEEPAVVITAAFLNDVRLIDNLALNH
jgi:pantoate--beta-alanine ligase